MPGNGNVPVPFHCSLGLALAVGELQLCGEDWLALQPQLICSVDAIVEVSLVICSL